MKKILGVLLLWLFILTSCGTKQSADIINPDADLLYFYGATCPHCQELNRRVEAEDLFSKISVEKREVYYNEANRQMFLDIIEKTKAERNGVPFVYDKNTGKYVVWVEPAFELFKSYVDKKTTPDPIIEEPMSTDENNSEENIINEEVMEEIPLEETPSDELTQ